MSVRLKDIARDLGVSVITVSKVLRNRSDISADTRARVLERVKALNYRPNLAARALVTGRTHLMGLVVPDLMHSFFAALARGLSGALREKGFSLVIASSEEDPKIERQSIEHFLARGVDALVIASVQQDSEIFAEVSRSSVPYILVDRRIRGLTANFVGVSDRKVGFIATNHLIDIGCRTIGHICGRRISPVLGRLEGYKQALVERGFSIAPDYIVTAESLDILAEAVGYNAAVKLLALNPCPDGIFCFNDPIAIGAMKAILEKGLRIPEDVALIGSGNLHYDNALRVPLSSIDQCSDLIGTRAAELAMKLVEKEQSARPKTIFLHPRLVVRDSTRR